MIIHELTQEECRDVLGRARFGRLACARFDQPYIVPFFFYLDPDRDRLYSFSTLGQKIEWMRNNPRVCVEVDEIVDQHNWKTVVAFGRFREISNPRKDEKERQRASELFQRQPAWWLPGLGKLTPETEHATPIIYRITIDKMTGRCAVPKPRP